MRTSAGQRMELCISMLVLINPPSFLSQGETDNIEQVLGSLEYNLHNNEMFEYILHALPAVRTLKVDFVSFIFIHLATNLIVL